MAYGHAQDSHYFRHQESCASTHLLSRTCSHACTYYQKSIPSAANRFAMIGLPLSLVHSWTEPCRLALLLVRVLLSSPTAVERRVASPCQKFAGLFDTKETNSFKYHEGGSSQPAMQKLVHPHLAVSLFLRACMNNGVRISASVGERAVCLDTETGNSRKPGLRVTSKVCGLEITAPAFAAREGRPTRYFVLGNRHFARRDRQRYVVRSRVTFGLEDL